jgi:ATP-dependent Clp protease protease subunit
MKKRAKKQKVSILPPKIDIDNILLSNRRVYLYSDIDSESALKVNKEITALANLDKESNIILEINSPGGSVIDGYSIINTIKECPAPVVTVINGEAASMAGIISVFGASRIILGNSWWMSHEISGGMERSKAQDIEATAEFIGRLKQDWITIMRQKTRLTEEDMNKAVNNQLWLSPEECFKKGIVDIYINKEGKVVYSDKIMKERGIK